MEEVLIEMWRKVNQRGGDEMNLIITYHPSLSTIFGWLYEKVSEVSRVLKKKKRYARKGITKEIRAPFVHHSNRMLSYSYFYAACESNRDNLIGGCDKQA